MQMPFYYWNHSYDLWHFSERIYTFFQASTSVSANSDKEKHKTTIQKVVSHEAYIKHPLQNK